MITTSAADGKGGEFLTIKDLERSLELLAEKAIANKEWILMAPSGVIYRGSAEEMIRMLVPHHPLMTIRPTMYEHTSYLDNTTEET